MSGFDNIKNKAKLEYILNEQEELETVLDQTNLNDDSKQTMRDAAQHIFTAKLLIEDNPLATDIDRQYLKDTEAKYQEVKENLINDINNS